MAPIKIKWDPEILAAGFRPSSIFDEAEVSTMASSSSAPVDVVGAQSTAAAAHPAHNVTGVLNTLVKDAVERVVALVVNTTASVATPPSTTSIAPVDVVGVQSAAAAVNPAHNLSTGVNALVEDAVRRVVALVSNTTTSMTTTSPTTTSTTFKRAVERTPEIMVEHVSIILL